MGTTGDKAVGRRAVDIPVDYKRKAAKMDQAMGVEEGEEGPCQRRLAELPLITLCWGAYREGSSGVHTLVTLHTDPILAGRPALCQKSERAKKNDVFFKDYRQLHFTIYSSIFSRRKRLTILFFIDFG